MTDVIEALPTLHRWLRGERVGPLPVRGAEHAPPQLSFEFFPPRTETLEQQLWSCIRRLEPLTPRFVSVTYGAGGTTQARTHATVARLVRETRLVPAAHLTCVGATREEVDAVARDYWEAGVRHIVALRGDPPPGTPYVAHPGGYAYASDLVAGLRRTGTLKFQSRPIPRHIRPQKAQATIWIISNASWMPAPPGPSRSIFSIRRRISASLSGVSPPVSLRRSCRASCRFQITPRRRNFPPCAARLFRRGSATCSKAPKTIRRSGAKSQPSWRRNRSAFYKPTASMSSISIRSIGRT